MGYKEVFIATTAQDQTEMRVQQIWTAYRCTHPGLDIKFAFHIMKIR